MKESVNNQLKKIYFPNLDGLRFIAFFAIFLHHGIFSFDEQVTSSTVFEVIKTIIKPAGLGVPFFFCLSGFLITYLLLFEVREFGKIHIGKFYVRRVLRIWPLYYAVIIFGFFIFPYLRSFVIAESYEETASLWKYLLFLSNFDQITNGLPYGAGLGVTWSLSVEEQFYLFWPLLLTLVNKKYYLHLNIFLFALANVLTTFFDVPYSHTLGSLTDLSIGGALAVMTFNKPKLFDRLSQIKPWQITLSYLVGISLIYALALGGYGHRALISFFMAFVIFEQCFCLNSVVKMGRFKRMSYLGTLTYGFYLLHTIANFVSHNSLKLIRDKLDMPFVTDLLLQPLLSLALTLLMGYLSYNFYEKPFLKLKSKFTLFNTSKEVTS